MALVAFMRGVNVGGNRVFQPSQLAKELVHLGVSNVGAAGTFVITVPCGQGALRAELLRRLTFPADLMICRGIELTDLVAREPFPPESAARDLRRFVSILAKTPRTAPRLPFTVPANAQWQVKVVAVSGRFVLAWWRRLGRSFVDPNGVVEKSFGVTATTRNWNTIVRIANILNRPRAASPGRGRRSGRP
jgi:uncharacterized protein (DUF1697 family)